MQQSTKSQNSTVTPEEIVAAERMAIERSFEEINLSGQYRDCLNVIASFDSFQRKYGQPSLRRFFIYIRTLLAFKAPKNIDSREKYRQLNSEMVIRAIPEAVRKDVFCTVLMSRGWNQGLSALLQHRFPDYSFMSLLKLARIIEKQRQQDDKKISVRKVMAYTGAALAFLLQITPEVVVRDIGLNYPDYQRVAFWATFVIASYIIVVLVLIQALWEFFYQPRAVEKRLLDVLEVYFLVQNRGSKVEKVRS